ncbi:MAG: hypothetical protein GX883_09715, partial [Firmicutes bacterium]|nr:hypothetical protein [Bacillota bacterium]
VGREFTLVSRNPTQNIVMKRGAVSVGLGRGAPFIVDYDGSRRSSTTDDFLNAIKVGQSLDVIDHCGPLLAVADVPRDLANLWRFYLTLKYSDKTGVVYSGFSIEMLCILFGISRETMKEQARTGQVYGQISINPTSPLFLGESQCLDLLEMAEIGFPLMMSPMPVASTTAPCTLPGTLILQNCEIMAPLVLSQLINPGTPVLYGTISSVADMKTFSALYGSPEVRLIESVSVQIAQFYDMLSRGDVGLTDAITCDFQAGAESMFQFLNTIRSGINYLPGCGHLGSFLEGSLEKIVLDAEIAEYAERFFTPLEFNEDTMAVDLIKKVGIQGQFMTEPHTLEHFRKEFYNPTVFSRMTYEKWAEKGSKDALARAHERVNEILEKYERPSMDESVEQDLDKFLQAKFDDNGAVAHLERYK